MTQLKRVQTSGEMERAKYVPKANENLQENAVLNPELRQGDSPCTNGTLRVCENVSVTRLGGFAVPQIEAGVD